MKTVTVGSRGNEEALKAGFADKRKRVERNRTVPDPVLLDGGPEYGPLELLNGTLAQEFNHPREDFMLRASVKNVGCPDVLPIFAERHQVKAARAGAIGGTDGVLEGRASRFGNHGKAYPGQNRH